MKKTLLIIALFFISSIFAWAQSPEMTEDWSRMPPLVTPGKKGSPPSDALILYGSKQDISKWQKTNGEPAKWKQKMCGVLQINRTGSIVTKQTFGDAQYHVEWKCPKNFDPEEEGQGRGNSGFYIMGLYEVQILDSYENETYYNGQAGSIYKQSAPLVNASRKPGKWQSYDIIFHGPRFNDDGRLLTPATVTVFHNGVLIQDHFIIKGPSVYGGYPKYFAHDDKLPLLLQDHGNPIQFRNIWVREL
jgi:hypothetical protein